jgi:hypothetical protein
MAWALRLLSAVYGLLLLAYPARFRAEFAHEMQQVFAEALDRAAAIGLPPAIAVVARELAQAPRPLVEAHWREWQAGLAAGRGEAAGRDGRMNTNPKVILFLVAALLLGLLGFVIPLLTGSHASFLLSGAPILAGLAVVLALGLAWVAQRIDLWGWIVVGGLMLAGLTIWGDAGYSAVSGGPERANAMLWFVLVMPAAALVVAALLFQNAIGALGDRRAGRSAAVLSVAVAGLLLARTLDYVYWLLVWDSTYDAIDVLLLSLPSVAVLASGLAMVAFAQRRRPWAAGYAVLVPLLLAAVAAAALRTDYRQLTERRAAQVAQRVEAFYARQGHYPASLQQAAAWYALPLPRPVTIYGHDWCYQAGEEHYQLGYVYREHWSYPRLIAQTTSARGTPPDADTTCADEIAAIRESHPAYYGMVPQAVR